MCLCHLSQRHVGVLGIGRLVVFLFRQCIAFCISAGYTIDNICRGTRETISDLNRSLRARYLVSVLDERTSFASWARAFESTRLLNCFECAFDKKVAYVFIVKQELPATATNLIITTPRTSCIYFLPKIHKPNNPGRPFVSACSCPTELISSYLDKIMSPIIKSLPSYIKDSQHALEIFRDFNRPFYSCSDDSDFSYKFKEMCQFFEKRGYPASVIQTTHHRSQQTDRQSALQTSQKEKNDRTPFTLTITQLRPSSLTTLKYCKMILKLVQFFRNHR